MPIPLDAPEVLDREFLEIRAKLLQIAAALDRIGRADGSTEGDRRLRQIEQALDVVASPQPDRAQRLQMIFSLTYDEDWRETFFSSEGQKAPA